MLAEETNLIIWISGRFPMFRIARPIPSTFIHRENSQIAASHRESG